MKRVVLIGSVVIDTIKTFHGERIVSPGGITYSLVGLAKLLPDYEILPVFHIGEADVKYFEDLVRTFPNISLEGMRVVKESNRNFLKYTTPEKRMEFFEQNTPGIEFEDVYPFLKARAVYINYIKNDDFSLQNLRSLSSYFRSGPIYIDIHSLVRKVDEDGRFRPYFFSGWQSLVQYADYLQMNLEELKFFTGFEVKGVRRLKMIIAMILINGPQGVSITLGSKGVLSGVKKGQAVQIEKFPPGGVSTKDPTGCGDIFGAALLSRILAGDDYLKAAEYAVKTASIKAGLTLEEFISHPVN